MPGRRGLFSEPAKRFAEIAGYMTRSHLRSVAHIIAMKLFENHPSGSIESEAINIELIAACRDPRNSDMTSKQFTQCAALFVPRELGRLIRRQARALAEAQ